MISFMCFYLSIFTKLEIKTEKTTQAGKMRGHGSGAPDRADREGFRVPRLRS